MVQESLITKVDSRQVELIYLYTVILYNKIFYVDFVIYPDVWLSSKYFLRIQWTELKLTKLNWIYKIVDKLFLPMSNRFDSTPFDSIDIIELPDNRYLKQLIESSTKLSAHWLLLFVMIQDWLLP